MDQLPECSGARPPPPKRTPALPLMPVPTHHADALKSCFRDVFGCRGREFGSLSRGVLGISDGNEGVQWNAGYYPRDGAVWLGVNLEGMKYDDWPVARLIEREISRPLLLTRYRRKGRETRQSHRALGARRVAVLRPTPDQGGESRPHADRAGSPRWSGLGGCPARREGMPGSAEATSRPQEGSGHAAAVETAPSGTAG